LIVVCHVSISSLSKSLKNRAPNLSRNGAAVEGR
jgi:hypothetical protein